MVLTPTPPEREIRRRTRRDPRPHFKPIISGQLDAVLGCPELTVPADHLCRQVWDIVRELDISAVEARYSSLGRHGYHPRNLLAVWVYASLIGIHYASALARALKTDAALRLLSGGYEVSAPTLKRFRQYGRILFQSALEQTVREASARGLLPTDELAVDSMRLRAHASKAEVRTLSRSKERLAELDSQLAANLAPETRAELEKKRHRHEQVVRECADRHRTSLVRTNSSAGLIKFPGGGSAPGHRLTVTASGRRERIVVGVLLDAAPNDHGHVEPAVEQAVAALRRAGVSCDHLRVLADAGYWDEPSLVYAAEHRDSVELLIAEQPSPGKGRAKLFQHDAFRLSNDGRTVHCPASKPMKGPKSHGRGLRVWRGDGCPDCELRSECCAPGTEYRKYTCRPSLEAAREDMRERLDAPENVAAYRRRMAIIEPVFASLQAEMGFRRASSRARETVIAEVLLKLLAHNVRRLAIARGAGSLSCVWVDLTEF